MSTSLSLSTYILYTDKQTNKQTKVREGEFKTIMESESGRDMEVHYQIIDYKGEEYLCQISRCLQRTVRNAKLKMSCIGGEEEV